MAGYGSIWFDIVPGVLAIVLGVYSLLRTGSVASWLESQGVRQAVAAAVFRRQIRTLAVFFILAGVFFVAVAIRNG